MEDRALDPERSQGRVTDYSPFDGRRREPAAPVLVEQLWSLRSAQSGKLLTCGLYTHPFGIEARCSLGDARNLLKSQVTKTRDEARSIAEEWRHIVMIDGFASTHAAQKCSTGI
jgi:hypothetical protein